MIKYEIFLKKYKCQKCIFKNKENRKHMEKEISIATKPFLSKFNIMQDLRTNFQNKNNIENMQINQKWK